ncbi:MAG: DUF2299 family protein [Nitrosarchaeum sp.]|nr:DUF2299 family protein [Nitrosarchaeum sp.]MBP0120390.1 DUF2299 family protein [Nitrosarchaeum sp.]MBP0134567.1 DUF2299 family protein [Nitrosarchaeum sp.]PHY09043.1 MAG: hypothetical protein CK527_03725 [Nitrosarchaeum sp.]
MTGDKMKESVERWLIHENHSFQSIKNPENNFQIIVKHAGQYGTPVEIFEPKSQPGIIVISAKVIMKDNQIARFLGFNEEEKTKFEKKMHDFCNSIQAISKIITEDGKQKIGVFLVLDDKENINQQTVFDGINKVSDMYEKTARFLMKTF